MQPRKKYQVFISSTYEDLREERNELVRSCLKIGHIPIGMEMFSAASAEQWEIIKRTIDGCDYYVVIVAHRYGSVVEADGGISYTEKEYDYAVLKGIPVLGLVLDQSAPWAQNRCESDEQKRKKLENFRSKVKSRMVSLWKNTDELGKEFIAALAAAIESQPRIGWLPANMAADPAVSNELARLSEENSKLRSLVEGVDPQEVRLVQIAQKLSQIASEALLGIQVKEESLLAFFRLVAPTLRMTPSSPRGVLDSTRRRIPWYPSAQTEGKVLVDLWALEAHRFIDAREQNRPGLTTFSVSPLGLEYLRYEERERMIPPDAKI